MTYAQKVAQNVEAHNLCKAHFNQPVRLLGEHICAADSDRTVIGRVTKDTDGGISLFNADGKMFAYVARK